MLLILQIAIVWVAAAVIVVQALALAMYHDDEDGEQ